MSQASIERIALWRDRPDIMVRDLFKVTPDGWQERALQAFPHKPRLAMKASKGVGKTALEAWLVWNFMLTRAHPKIACTAVDGKNLSDNLWTELAMWQGKSDLLLREFEWTKTRISSRQYPETWWCSARTWSKTADKNQQSNTLAGLHADNIMFVIDESGGLPSALMASAEAALSTCKEGHIVQAGNPTHLEGPLYDACTSQRAMWEVITINSDPDNPERSSLVSIEWAKQQIKAHGRDNPWVKVNVFGEFPPSSINSLIGPDDVEAAMKRYYREHEIGAASKVLGVDVARFGDDSSVICLRQGIQVFRFQKYRNIDSTQGAGAVATTWRDFDADACFIDNTGGWGTGWIDQLVNLGKSPIGIGFAQKAQQDQRYANKRAEMYFNAVEWIKQGGALPPDCHELLTALTRTTYTFQGDRLLLESKDDIREKLGYSPDEADAFVLTFAHPVARKQEVRRTVRMPTDFNPYREVDTARGGSYSGAAGYNPYAD